MTRFITTLLLMATLTTAPTAFGAESPGVLLQKGIQAEESAGNLDEAIQIYRQIIEQARSNRQYVAQAHFRLGVCLMKAHHEKEAAAEFERLISEFPEETGLIAQARKYLPAPACPDIVGCRLRESISLQLQPPKLGWQETVPTRSLTVYEYTIVNIQWDLAPTLAGKTLSFGFQVGDFESGVTKAKTRSVEVGGPETSPKGVVGLTAGDYTIRVGAYDAKKEQPGVDSDHLVAVATARLTVKPLPRTQITINDLKPDGTIDFRFVGQRINDGVRDVTTDGFSNSDFVHITSMSDDQGRPLEFTEKHDDRMFRYHVKLNTPVPPGQPILIMNEGTQSGLIRAVAGTTDAFRYYMKHWPATGVPTRRIEVYRLPKGAELLQTTPKDMARRTENGRTELCVDKMIPAGGSIVTSFSYRLSGARVASQPVSITQPSIQPLKLKPAPWVDNEALRLKIISEAGAEFGEIIYTARGVDIAGKSAWQIESWMVIPMVNMMQYTRVDASRQTFTPISSRTYNNELGDYRAEYGPDKVKLTVGNKGKTSTREVDVQQPVFDNEQAIYVIRRMPLAEGYRSSFEIFSVVPGSTIDAEIEVTGKEEVTVPAGTFDCHKLALTVSSSGVRVLQHTLWLSADEHQYLVKYKGDALMELAEISREKPSTPAVFENKELGIRVTAPPGWFFYTSPLQKLYKLSTYMLGPGMKVWSLLTVATTDSAFATPREAAEGDVEVLKGFFKDYKVRTDSWKDFKVAGLPAAQYVADYEEDGQSMVEYRTYILGKSLLYWFVFRVEKDQFTGCRPELDSIIDSFQATAGTGKAQTRPARR